MSKHSVDEKRFSHSGEKNSSQKNSFGKEIKIMKRTLFFSILLLVLVVQVSYAGDNTFPDSGNVGIGTAGPGYGLHLYRGNGISPTIAIDAYDNNHNGVIKFIRGGIDSEALKITSDFGGSGSEYGWSMNFYANGQTMTLKNGNVGIGTTNPQSKLHVVGKIYSTTEVQGGYAIMKAGTGKAIFGSNSAGVPILITRDANDGGWYDNSERSCCNC